MSEAIVLALGANVIVLSPGKRAGTDTAGPGTAQGQVAIYPPPTEEPGPKQPEGTETEFEHATLWEHVADAINRYLLLPVL